jgi:hypothetical protein
MNDKPSSRQNASNLMQMDDVCSGNERLAALPPNITDLRVQHAET